MTSCFSFGVKRIATMPSSGASVSQLSRWEGSVDSIMGSCFPSGFPWLVRRRSGEEEEHQRDQGHPADREGEVVLDVAALGASQQARERVAHVPEEVHQAV